MMSTSHPVPSSNRGRFAALLATALLALAVFAGSAQACSYSGAEKVFSPWGDQRSYVLAPDGGFEAGGSGWQLNRGATVVEGNESYYLNDAGDSKSLSLPAGSSAVSPPVCMALDTPSFRLVARNSGDPSSQLRVEAVYRLLGLDPHEDGRHPPRRFHLGPDPVGLHRAYPFDHCRNADPKRDRDPLHPTRLKRPVAG